MSFPSQSESQNDGSLSDNEVVQLERLKARQIEADRIASAPTKENATHWVHLSDGRVLPALSGAGTTYSEGKGTADDPEVFTQVIGVYPR